MTPAKDTSSRPYEVGPELMELGQEIPQDKTVGDCSAGKYNSLLILQTADYSTGKSTALFRIQHFIVHYTVQNKVL